MEVHKKLLLPRQAEFISEINHDKSQICSWILLFLYHIPTRFRLKGSQQGIPSAGASGAAPTPRSRQEMGNISVSSARGQLSKENCEGYSSTAPSPILLDVITTRLGTRTTLLFIIMKKKKTSPCNVHKRRELKKQFPENKSLRWGSGMG